MKYLVVLTTLVFSVYANAEVSSLWPAKSAIIIIQGNDTDSEKLYEAMTVGESSEEKGIVTKEVNFSDESDSLVFTLGCNKSTTTEVVSCTLKILDSPKSYLKKSKKLALVRVENENLETLFSSFSGEADEDGVIFRSEENQLSISLYYADDGMPKLFRIAYRDSGLNS